MWIATLAYLGLYDIEHGDKASSTSMRGIGRILVGTWTRVQSYELKDNQTSLTMIPSEHPSCRSVRSGQDTAERQ